MKPLTLSELAPIALRGRHAGELLAQPCGCSTRRHRWRITGCPDCTGGQTIDEDTGARYDCPTCWIACDSGTYFDAETQDFRPCPLCRPHTLGEHVWHETLDFAVGPRAQRTDTSHGGRRLETVDLGNGPELVEVPNGDPVGEAVLLLDDPTGRAHTEYQRRLAAYLHAADELELFITGYRPDRTVIAPTQKGEPDHCRHHMDTIGTWELRYRGDQCRWCYDFERARGIKPPEPLLTARHEGRRLTDKTVTDAVRAVNAKAKGGKNGGKRKRRKAG